MLNQHEKLWLLIGVITIAGVIGITKGLFLGWLTFGVFAIVYAIWHYYERNRPTDPSELDAWERIRRATKEDTSNG